MLKTLDIYIIKKFLGTFFFTIILIIGIAIVFDISEKIDDFLENDAPLKDIVFDYYLNFIPYYVNLFIFLFTFISVVFFTSKMANHCEIIAIRSCGVSFARMLLPYFISASIIAVIAFFLSNLVIPRSNYTRINFENTYLKGQYKNYEKNIHKQVEPGTFIYLESYRTRDNFGYKFSMEKFENGELKSKLIADYIKWDSVINKWSVHNYYIRNYTKNGEDLDMGRKIDTTFRITPEEFSRRINIVETMNTPDLSNFIEEQQLRGSDTIESFLIEKHKRVAFPFSTFILTLIGVSLASQRLRGGTGMHIGLGLLISFSYILFMQISFQFAIKGNMEPLLAVWIPNIIFGLISVFLYFKAPK